MVRKMFEKAGAIQGLNNVPRSIPGPTSGTEGAKVKTAPGTMMGFLTQQSTAIQEAESLRERVRTLESDSPLKKLDPRSIRPSKWANRHPASFLSEEFELLKAEIAASEGNIQPIKVRPVPVLNGSTPTEIYEVVFGHRRHQACLALSLPVLAAIEDVTDVVLFEQMERENRGRKNLSAWEQGAMYRRALDEGLYPSLRRLSEGLGVDVSLVSKSVSLARLPDAVVTAFSSPLDIQFRWAAPLTEALQKDPEGVLARAQALSTDRGGLGAAAVLAAIVGAPTAVGKAKAPGKPLTISNGGKVIGTLADGAKGRVVITLEPGALPDSKRKALVRMIEESLRA